MFLTFQPPPHLTVQLAGNGAPGTGRRGLSELLSEADAELRESALLVVSELVTNAIQAARECTVSAWFRGEIGAVRIEVTDTARGLPAIRPPGDGRAGGYGLRIVDQVSTRWGVVEHEVGKMTWSEIERPEVAAPHS